MSSPRVLGVFAHPDDEVFCVGGTIARCAADGAVTGLVSLTQGEAGQIRDAEAASRRTLGAVRVKELEASARVLGVDHVACLDYGDGRLAHQDIEPLVDIAGEMIEDFAADVVVTFGPDGGFGHPDHIVSSEAALRAVRQMPRPPRVLHAKFPLQGQLMIDTILEWLQAQGRFSGGVEFGHALKLFADGATALGVAADHVRVEWYPPGAYIIEQDEPASELFCLLSGTADIVAELDDGRMQPLHVARSGAFVGEDSFLSGRPRNAHVVARDAVTCLVLSPQARDLSAGRGLHATVSTGSGTAASGGVEDCIMVSVRSTLERKVAALAAHRSQYALSTDLLPLSMLDRLLGTERFVVADPQAP
jgi:LmbE family N-acetylglucosaminyl deacetylase